MAFHIERPAKRRFSSKISGVEAQGLAATGTGWSTSTVTGAPSKSDGVKSNSSASFFYRSPLLPDGFEPLPSHLSDTDWQYLFMTGALTIPNIELRDELLRSYARYVHPLLPMLDLRHFIAAVEGNGILVSLLLYQAVMFAAVQFVEVEILSSNGFSSCQTARRVLFQRAKLLYEMDCEEDAVVIVQALQLLTSWFEVPTPLKDAPHWCSVATSIARGVGMNRAAAHGALDEQQRRLWRRTWWCCVMRDRLIACGWNRTMSIRNEDFDIPMLNIEDFDLEEFPSQILARCTDIMRPSYITHLAKICIALAKLCLKIADILNLQYCIRPPTTLSSHGRRPTVRLVPKQNGSDIYDVVRCDEQLHLWLEESTPVLRLYDEYEADRLESSAVVALHAAVLKGIYLCATNALHRPQISSLIDMNNPSLVAKLHKDSREKVNEATNSTTELFKSLLDHRMIRYLPSFSTTFASFAAVFYILQLKSSSPFIRQFSFVKLEIITRALEELKDMYAQVEHVLNLIRTTSLSIKRQSLSADSFPSSSGNLDRRRSPSLDLYPATPTASSKNLTEGADRGRTSAHSRWTTGNTPGTQPSPPSAQTPAEAMVFSGTLTEGEKDFFGNLNLLRAEEQISTSIHRPSPKDRINEDSRARDHLYPEGNFTPSNDTQILGPSTHASGVAEYDFPQDPAFDILEFHDFESYLEFDEV
ncbi:hypothetical protein H2198_010579 [Neophaeococcomyces mojaviensis]|uniref:Uncharacterized protein n=1 Tax=Neophaeococcomyces mojaviensis TaxID=3383035 RepID=A0ACC2ZR41_9EURO|nr:hypothetical protein H2198_010579 [Knufia sp. JES_112]